MYILDTDHLGILQRGGSVEFERLMDRIAEAGDENIYLTIISFHEVITGWTKYVKNSGDQERIVAGYQRLEQILSDFASAQVLPYTPAAAEVFDDLRRQKVRVATMDLRVAAIAISRRMTVLTRNTVDFERVPGLLVEDWTIHGQT